ncbi:MAG: GyrI-like domain-containing protein [Planctomyces sp.]|nr:GyrI-like domain-containing protein [Planctomyces sp.]
MGTNDAEPQVEEKRLEPLLVAGIRMRGRYRDCGVAFGKLGRQFGRLISGPPLLLIYDREFREDDADFEACLPLREARAAEGVDVRELPGGRCLSLLHRGPYEEIGRSYGRLFQHLQTLGVQPELPTREVYLKGPGMFFRGNPRKYLTEIQALLP